MTFNIEGFRGASGGRSGVPPCSPRFGGVLDLVLLGPAQSVFIGLTDVGTTKGNPNYRV